MARDSTHSPKVKVKSSKVFYSPFSRPLLPTELLEVYQILQKEFGHQQWWPGETPFEVMVGAVLTQNTAWTNVEKAISNLKQAGLLNLRAMNRVSIHDLSQSIRPAGYFNVKAKRLKSLVAFIFHEYQGDLDRMKKEKGEVLRIKLLGIHGIGPETADSILLYALDKPHFVIDAYTKRIFSRHRLDFPKRQGKKINSRKQKQRAVHFIFQANNGKRPTQKHKNEISHLLSLAYQEWQDRFTKFLPQTVPLFNDFHAQIVLLAKRFCKSSQPNCSQCPLRKLL